MRLILINACMKYRFDNCCDEIALPTSSCNGVIVLFLGALQGQRESGNDGPQQHRILI